MVSSISFLEIIKKSYLKVFILLGILNIHCYVSAQLPKTEVWVADFKNIHTQPSLLSLTFLSGFNPEGYNNQPSFFDYNEIYLTSNMRHDTTTDIYALNIKNKTIRQVTDTPQISEFSPTKRPNSKEFSTVRIEEDGKDQSLWVYPMDRSHMGSRFFESLNNIGYYAWDDKNSLALFLVSKPHQFALANVHSGEINVLIDNIGRCLKTEGDGNIYFVQKISPVQWMLKKYDTQNKVISTIIKMPFESEDFDILPNGSFISSQKSKIFIYNPKKDNQWQVLYDFSEYGLKNLQRPILMRDRIVFVENKI